MEREGLKTDSGFQNVPNKTAQIPNSVPEIHLEDYNMGKLQAGYNSVEISSLRFKLLV